MSHEHRNITRGELFLADRERAVEALRPFAGVGDPMRLDLTDPAVEEALRLVDAWEHAARRSGDAMMVRVLADSLYVKAGFHDAHYLVEVYMRLEDAVVERLDDESVPREDSALRLMHNTQSTIRQLLEEQGRQEELDHALYPPDEPVESDGEDAMSAEQPAEGKE
jgi:hypothetical protein